MKIVIKQKDETNHIYVMDVNMRPIEVKIANKEESVAIIKNLREKFQISTVIISDKVETDFNDDFSNQI